MAKVLFITAHPLDHTKSMSMEAGRAFVETYKEINPQDAIEHLDLYAEHVPHLDADILTGWEALQAGGSFGQLSPAQQGKVGRLNQLVDQFTGADKYVFVTPMWNFGSPPVVKAYFDALCVAGKTFRFSESGPVGLLTGRKALHIQARGGMYQEGMMAQFEMGHRYLCTILQFFGISPVEGVFVEGHRMFPDRAGEIREGGVQRARDLAATF